MYYFIINPKSRSGKGINNWTLIKQELNRQNIEYTFYITSYPFHATEITKEICTTKEGIKKIVALGGDGTVNEIINGITNFNEVLLGYIPSGSSNDLARSLNLPKDPLINLSHLLSPSRFRYIDMGSIRTSTSDYKGKFLISTGTGFDAAICEETFRSGLKKILNRYGLGKLTYIIIGIKQLLSCQFMEGSVLIDGKEVHYYNKILMITSMIHKYEGGGMQIAPAANPYDGQLSVCIVHGISRFKILTLFPTLLFGKHVLFKGVENFNCQTMEIKLKDPAYVHIDGECPGLFHQINISCITNKLRIMI